MFVFISCNNLERVASVVQQRILSQNYGVPVELAAKASSIASTPIHEENVGHKMLTKLGWSGKGLGVKEQGVVEPIGVVIKNNKLGVGISRHS